MINLLRFAPRVARAAGLLAAAALAYPAAAQTFDWAQPRTVAYTRNPDLLRTAAALAPDGSGWWAGLEQYRRPYSQEALGSLQLTRLRPGGAPALQRIVEGSISILQLQATPDGGALLLGEYKDSLVFDAQHRYQNPSGASNLEYFLTSLDSLGAVRWYRPLRPGSGATDVQNANALTLDPRGTSVWAGYDTFGDSYATRFDLATGDSLSSIVQQNVSLITSIAIAPDGTVYVAGSGANTVGDFNGTAVPLPAGISYNTYVACYSAAGALRWVRHVEDVTGPSTYVATADTTGVYFAGGLTGPWQFGSFQAATPTFNSGAYFLTRLSAATGNFQWLRESPGAAAPNSARLGSVSPLATDAAGNAWLLVNGSGTLTWPGFSPIMMPAGGAATLVAYSPMGTVRGVQAAGGRASAAHTLAIDPATGRGLIAGIARGGGVQLAPLAALPTVAATEKQVFAAGFRAVLSPLGTHPDATTTTFGAYPNPVRSGATVRLPDPAGTVEVFDVTGRRVGGAAGSAALTAPARPGLYLLRHHDALGHLTGQSRLLVE